jgi:hypothetical protein
MTKKTHGTTASGVPITDALVERLAQNADAGYNVEETLRRRGGRPTLGSGPASVESVRLEPELRDALQASPGRPRNHILGLAQGTPQIPSGRLSPRSRERVVPASASAPEDSMPGSTASQHAACATRYGQ